MILINLVDYYCDENGDDAEDGFIMLNIVKNTSAIDLVFVLISVINNDSLQVSLLQYRY